MEFIVQDEIQEDIIKPYFSVKPEPRSADFISDARGFGRILPRLLKLEELSGLPVPQRYLLNGKTGAMITATGVAVLVCLAKRVYSIQAVYVRDHGNPYVKNSQPRLKTLIEMSLETGQT